MLSKEKLIEIFKNKKILITSDAIDYIYNFLNQEKKTIDFLNNIIEELAEKKEIITKEIAEKIIKNRSSLKFKNEVKTTLVAEKYEEIEPSTSGYLGIIQDRLLKTRKLIEKIHNKRPTVDLAHIEKCSENQSVSVLGMVFSIEEGRFDSLIVEIEDLFGSVRVIIPNSKLKGIDKIEEDDIILVEGKVRKGKAGIYILAENIIYPELEFTAKSEEGEDILIATTSDIRYGNENFSEEKFMKFIDFLNGHFEDHKEIAKKIKYLIICGDLIEGVSFESKYSGLVDEIEEEYTAIAKILDKIRKDIEIIIIPGERDVIIPSIPLSELSKEIAQPLYEIKNIKILTDPNLIHLGNRKILLTHGFYFENIARKYMLQTFNGERTIELTIKHIFKRRNLVPNLRINGLLPIGYDPFIITEKPDLFIFGHFDIPTSFIYKQCLVVSNSSWVKYNKEEDIVVYLINMKDLKVSTLHF
jgi:DNA polymerase II small subunit